MFPPPTLDPTLVIFKTAEANESAQKNNNKKIAHSQAFPPPVYDQLQYADWKPGNEVQLRRNNLHSDKHASDVGASDVGASDVGRTWHPGQTADI